MVGYPGIDGVLAVYGRMDWDLSDNESSDLDAQRFTLCPLQ